MAYHDQNIEPLTIEQLAQLAPKVRRVLFRLELTSWMLSFEGAMPDDIKQGAFADFIEEIKEEAGEAFNFVERFTSLQTD